jgi:signal transduction histidine kinase/ActR/RegA family two-component response regulator
MTTLDQRRAHAESARHGTDARSDTAAHLSLDADPRAPELPTLGLLAAEAQLQRRKLLALGTLAGNIADDFGSALLSITGNTALAQRCLEPGHPAHALLDEVARASARADDLVQRILRFSRPDQSGRGEISLRTAVEEGLELVRPTLPGQIALRAQLSDSVGDIVADPAQVHELIVNLATNAAHAIGAGGGTIDVCLGTTSLLAGPGDVGHELPAGSYAVLQVSDNGTGMDAGTLSRIFDPFFTTKPSARGTGLGLSAVHGIMKGLGGAVTARSELSGGTTFSLYFPTREARSETSCREVASPADTRVGRVLFVDDDEPLVSLGTHMLEVLGYQVSSTSQPLAALKRFAAEPRSYDAVVTDLSMPGLSGFQLSQQLLAVRADVPIVVMCGYVGPDERSIARKVGVRDLLLKPVGMDDLNRTLARVLATTRRRVAIHKS